MTARGRKVVIESAICALVIATISVIALWKMDYLGSATSKHVRMNDSARTAYVAKNIVDGNGYSTNDLSPWMLKFYDDRGQLHQSQWTNADRFPFTAYAIAFLYTITGSTSSDVGVMLYNLLWFIVLITSLYWLARSMWGDRYAAVLSVALALLHPDTLIFLYMKDADSTSLVIGVMACFHRYFSRQPARMSWVLAAATGTMLGWLFLARVNVSMPLLAYFGFVSVRIFWTTRRELGIAGALRDLLKHEGLVFVVFTVWCIPFAIHSLSEWGTPFFTANSVYQLPLGTRFLMGTDPWWKYADPTVTYDLSMLLQQARGEMLSKFPSTWLATLKDVVGSYGIEMLLTFGLLALMARRSPRAALDASEPDTVPGEPPPSGERTLRRLAVIIGITVLLNLAILPLYGYQATSLRYYLSFFLPLFWIAGGKALALLAAALIAAGRRVLSQIRKEPAPWMLIAAAGFLVWNFSVPINSGLFGATRKFMASHWLLASGVLAFALWHRHLRGRRAFAIVVVVLVALVIVRNRPMTGVKAQNLVFFPAGDQVWKVLRERTGLVSSMLLPSEVAWETGRRNIPAPDLVMHIYSIQFDRGLEIEDLYLESADLMTAEGGVFGAAAPGFEGYARLEKYQGRLPGYELVFHDSVMKGYPKYRIKPVHKSSTVYRLVDRAAIAALRHSPDRIALGDVASVVHTAHGFGDYFKIEGKQAVAATDSTRSRYTTPQRPWEDTGITFFLDDRRPTSIQLEVYGARETTLQFYWNLDLYQYDLESERTAHQLEKRTIKPGWQVIQLEVPVAMTRTGLNKLGFRATQLAGAVVCPDVASAECVRAANELATPENAALGPRVVIPGEATVILPMQVSAFLGLLQFSYAH